MAELRKSHSNYILRKKRQLTTKGAIYERDWMTVSEMDGFAPGTLPVYASGNFKMTINNERTGKKKYSFSNWVLNENGDENWTLSMIKNEDLRIRSELIKPNYSSILDFAYYGSCVELIKGSVNHILKWYPGEIYAGTRTIAYYDDQGTRHAIENVVENPFNIDVVSAYIRRDKVENPYRYFALSWDKYEVVDDSGNTYPILAWYPGNVNKDACANGDSAFTDVRIYIERNCEDEGTSSSTECPDDNLTGRVVDRNREVIVPVGNCFPGQEPSLYKPKLQKIVKDIHEYNNPYYSIPGYVDENDPNAIWLPLNNPPEDNGGYSKKYSTRLIKVEKEPSDRETTQVSGNTAYVWGGESAAKEETALIPFIALEPRPGIDPTQCDSIILNGVIVDGIVYITSNQTGLHIKLQDKYIDEIFDSFDDFEKVLLNRDTKPKYKATFITPEETDRGVIAYEKSYTWPVLEGKWNLDFESGRYTAYINGLLYIATYYDDCRADNIWRSYTHESIKNFDWTTPRDTYVPEIEGHLIDVERMEAILKVCGRQFDDLKRYIENIKFTVNVSYDSKNNMPEKNMAKFLEMCGWEVKNVSPINDNSILHVEEYPGIYVKYTPEDANLEFLKRMILNSRNLLSKKGTRAGIEEMYSMFGLFEVSHGYEYPGNGSGFTIDEFEAFATNYISSESDDYGTVYRMNQEKDGFQTQFEKEFDDFCGLMAGQIAVGDIQYIIPWYNLYSDYDGYPYYQMFGGWGKRQRKDIRLMLAPRVPEIYSDSAFTIYDETVKNIKVVENFKELNRTPIGFLEEGDIFYVLNMTEAYEFYGCEDGNDSHYVFFTGNTYDFDRVVPYNDDYNWCLVSNSEFTGTTINTWYAKKIVYMESIHDVSAGNNPHNGKGKYDGGKEYFKYYDELFKGAIDEDMFKDYRERVQAENSRRHYDNRFRANKLPDVVDESDTVSGISFNVTELVQDNSKIWYFLSWDSGIYDLERRNSAGNVEWSDNGFSVLNKVPFNFDEPNKKDKEFVGVTQDDFPLSVEERTCQNEPIVDTASTITYSGETLDIPASIQEYRNGFPSDDVLSYSVINTKNIRITYHLPWEMEDYITNVVEFYVKQLIPSTAIVEFVWDYTDGPRPAGKQPYAFINLSPKYQTIRANEYEAEIDVTRVNADGLEKIMEDTERI